MTQMNKDQSHGTTQDTQGTPAAPHARRSTQRAVSYQEQPAGIPDSTPITLDRDGAWNVFATVLHAVQEWKDSEDPLEQDEARSRLIRDCDALGVITQALRLSDRPYIFALLDDARASEEWQQARWFARGDRAREERDAAATAVSDTPPAVS